MAPPVLYLAERSSPCRAVLLAAAAVGIELDVKAISLPAGDHKKEDFLKMNPQHTIPTLNDNGFAIWDSHAIVTYLADKYGKDDSLYPKDLQKRAIINQRLHFNNSVLLTGMRSIFFPIFHRGAKTFEQEKVDLIIKAFEFLEKFLEDNDWLAGSTYTLADTTIIASVSSLAVLVSLDKFPKLSAWAKRCEETLPGYATANAPGVAIFHATAKSALNI